MKFITPTGLVAIAALVFVLICLCGCDNEPYSRQEDRPDCSAHKKELAAFVLECAKNANPLSDEEGEDLVRQCERTGERVVCPAARFLITRACQSCSYELYAEKVSK